MSGNQIVQNSNGWPFLLWFINRLDRSKTELNCLGCFIHANPLIFYGLSCVATYYLSKGRLYLAYSNIQHV